jgi:hypothetical protein
MGWSSQSPEVWLVSALLIAIVAAIGCAFLSHRTDARMIFFFHLIGDDPAGEDSQPRIAETSTVRLKQGT